MKICACCKESLNFKLFSKNSGTKDGLSIYCKACLKDKKKEKNFLLELQNIDEEALSHLKTLNLIKFMEENR